MEPIFSREHNKTNILLFLKALPFMEEMTDSLKLKLADRFKINPDNFKLLIHVTYKIGYICDN